MVSVYLRIKPSGGGGGSVNTTLTVQPPNTVTASGATFTFDRVLGGQSTQAQVYDTVARPLIADVLSGYNVTICSYGQTSSGKTFTTFGGSGNPNGNPGDLGYAFRATAEIMDRMDPGTRIAVSCLEIYMENIHDLLGEGTTNNTDNTLALRELPNGRVYVPDLTKRYVRTQAEIQQLWRRAESKRAVAATLMNNRSSRSHCILQLSVEQPNGLLALFNVVDLAGSERVKRSGATGSVLHEAQSINKSLFTLARVINLLADGGAPNTHIPYRDSKLTRLLQDSLGGTAKTAMIITVLGEPDSAEETLSSLRFAVRCKSVLNKPKINLVAETLEACQKRLAAAEAELARLNASLVSVPLLPPSPSCPRCEQLEMELEVIRNGGGGGVGSSGVATSGTPEIDWEKLAVKIPNQLHEMAAPELRQLVSELEAAQKFMKMRQQILYNAIVFRTHIIQNLEKKLAVAVPTNP